MFPRFGRASLQANSAYDVGDRRSRTDDRTRIVGEFHGSRQIDWGAVRRSGNTMNVDDDGSQVRFVTLNDGTPVPTRCISPDDAPALQRFHLKLSNYSVYLRHIHALPSLSDNQAKYFTDLKGNERFAIVALDPDDQSEIIAVVRFEGSLGSARAEYAALVMDAWQGKGLGTALTRDLIQVARQRGVTCLYATVLPENVRMLKLLRDLALPERLRFEDGVAEIELDLSESGDVEREGLAGR